MDFKVYVKSRTSGEVIERVAMRVSDKEGVVWLRNGGWFRLEDAFLTRERAEAHNYKDPPGMFMMPPDNER